MSIYRITVNILVNADNLKQAEQHSELINQKLSDWKINSISIGELEKQYSESILELEKRCNEVKENGFYIGLTCVN